MSGIYLKMRVWTFYPDYLIKMEMEKQKSVETFFRTLPYHPLLNTLVLEKIFSHVETSNLLLQFRRVCKTWNSEAIKLYRKRIPYKMLENRMSLTNLLKIHSKSKTLFPIEYFHLQITKMCPVYYSFLNSCSIQTQIVSLKVAILSDDFPFLLKNLPKFLNLKVLTVFRIPESSLESIFITRGATNTISSNLLISNFPIKSKLIKLEKVSFINSNPRKLFLCDYSSHMVGFLKCVENLKILEFYFWFNPLSPILRDVKLANLVKFVCEGRILGHNDITLILMKKPKKLQSIVFRPSKTVSRETSNEFLQYLNNSLINYKLV